jgi:hypothetical protein
LIRSVFQFDPDNKLIASDNTVKLSNSAQCAACNLYGALNWANIFVLPMAWQVTVQQQYYGFGFQDLLGAIGGVLGIAVSLYFRFVGVGEYRADGIMQVLAPTLSHDRDAMYAAKQRLEESKSDAEVTDVAIDFGNMPENVQVWFI